MVENRTRGEQLFKQARGSNPEVAKQGRIKTKVSGVLQNIRDLFGKQQGKGTAGDKKPGILAFADLSVQKLDLRSINHALMLILGGLIALTVYTVLRQRPDVASVAAVVSKIKYENLEEKVITGFEELAFYSEQIAKRDIFNEYEEPKPPPPVVVKPVEKPPPPPPPPKVTIQEKASALKLMGISWGDSPKVIIRNDAIQEVLFCSN